jgi:hypothetical protein
VIAKWCTKDIATVERTVYERILPHLPVTSVGFYGYIEERAGEYGRSCWLFLEDAAGRCYSLKRGRDRALAGRWLAVMHTAAAQLPTASELPDRSPSYYLKELQCARERILQNLPSPWFNADDRELLTSVVTQCDIAESNWDKVESFCEPIPCTLVHGDFKRKNVRVRTSASESSLFPLDWEMAGWGPPAPDLVIVDVPTYWTIVRDIWPRLGREDVGRLAEFGLLLRLLISIGWETVCLPWSEKDGEPLENLPIFHARMKNCFRTLGWGNL